jgi:hypothetical protein
MTSSPARRNKLSDKAALTALTCEVWFGFAVAMQYLVWSCVGDCPVGIIDQHEMVQAQQ